MPDSNLDTLLARLVDETITPEEFKELEARLDDDPNAQRRYLHYLDLHADLQELDEGRTDKAQGRRRLVTGLVAIAATILVALFVLPQMRTPKPLVQVVDLDGPVRWIGVGGETDAAISAGLELPVGTLETLTADSWVAFTFPDKTSVSMAGQSVVTISIVDGQKILRFQKGHFSLNVARQAPGRPLQVVSPSAEAEVLGTQFNVRVSAYATRFVVNEGRVRVTRLADGRIEEVVADEVLVAAMEQGSDFVAVPRRAYVEHWQSVLPRDHRQGRWEPADGSGLPGGVRAMPHLWKGEPGSPEKPTLLYTVVLDPSPRRQPLFRLANGARLHVQGRIDRKQQVHLGFATHYPRGGFAGKYSAPAGVAVETNEIGQFEFDLDLHMFDPEKESFPTSPVGLEVVYLWIQTVEVDAGLVIERVEWGE